MLHYGGLWDLRFFWHLPCLRQEQWHTAYFMRIKGGRVRSCFRQAVKWEMMDKNPAIDATLPKYKAEEREIWTAEMLMQAIDACENKWLKVAFHLAFAATVRLGELLGLT